MARIAKALDELRAQINAKYPGRSKISDGWIGDSAHAARASDHNPNSVGVVTGLDVTHDPARGFDSWKFADLLRINKDPRIKYVISNGRIFSSVVSPWIWRSYTGANKHAHHVHISVMGDASLYDLGSAWKIDDPIDSSAVTSRPIETRPMGITPDMRRRMAKKIIQFEGRIVNGKLAVYSPPANDGGGAFEVAGINVNYHPAMATRLRDLITAGKADQAENEAADYLIDYTKAAAGWTEYAGVEFYLRDSIFNRGPKGAVRILQRSLGVPDDGEIGPRTRAAMAKLTADELLTKLRAGRENYERGVVGYRANFWRGLVNRWDKALVAAREFQREQGALPFKKTVGTGAGTAVVAVTFWDWIVAHPVLSAILAASALTILVLGIRQLKASREKPPAHPIAPTPAIIEQEHP